MPEKPELAVFCPLPPTRAGTADYCYEQLPALARDWNLRMVVESRAERAPPLPDGVRAVNLADWKRDAARDRRTPRLYHLANNIHHEYALRESLERPGIAVFHDVVLHHLVVEMTLARGKETEYEAFMVGDHGELGRHVARQRSRYVFTEYQQFLMPLNGPAIRASLGVIVHSKWAARRVQVRHPKIPVQHVPMHFAPQRFSGSMDRAEARARLGIPADRVVFAMLGFVTPPKRLDLAIKALSRIRRKLPPFELLIVGEVRDPAGLARMVRSHGLDGVVRSTGWVSLEEFHRAIQASDVVINLRYPTAGETSATLIRALGEGRPAVVFNYASFADLPDSIAMKVDLDTNSTRGLEAALLRLGTEPALREALGQRARRYAATRWNLDRCGTLYTRFVQSLLASS